MSSQHPFLAEDFEIKWSRLSPEHIEADVTEALAQSRAKIEAIKKISAEDATYDNTFLALERATESLDRAWGRVNHLDSVANSDDLRAALNKMLPAVSEFSSAIALDDQLWVVLKNYSESGAAQSLNAIQKRFVEETCADFISAGADLPPEKKKRMSEVNSKLASLTQKFGENVLDDTKAWELYISDESRLAGLPESAKDAAAEDATAKGHEGQWRFTLHFPSLFPLMQHADDDSLRREIWQASSQVGHSEKNDNTGLIRDIIRLRQEKAELLGHKNFSDHILERRMAKNGDTALKFTADLHDKIHAQFLAEVEQLSQYKAKKTGQNAAPLEPWETAYWAEKQRKELFDLDDEEFRPYFPVDRVMDGLFSLVTKIYGIKIIPSGKDEVETWNPEVKFYHLRDAESDEHLGSFYADWHPRESKQGGAWFNYLETGMPPHEGQPRKPHLGLICGNLTKPTSKKPALLTHREVETIFHEFGHLLHHLLSDVPLESLAGVNVPWDFVELPSQLMENFCWDRESLDLFARHYESGETIPQDLFEKMLAARNYLSASACMRQLALGKLDLELHAEPEKYLDRDLDEVDREILADYKAPLASEAPSMARRFSHLFSSPVGYASGYYSYKWAEVLDADAFTRFQKEGLLNPETGRAFRREILARGNSRPVDDSYRAFMGRDPELQPLLERSGLA